MLDTDASWNETSALDNLGLHDMLMDAESSNNDERHLPSADVNADISPLRARKRKFGESASEESNDKSDSVLDMEDDSDAGTEEEQPPPPARHSKLTPYELAREQRKKDIAELMEAVGLNQATRDLNEAFKVTKKKRQKKRQKCPMRPSQTAQDDPAEDGSPMNSTTLSGRLHTYTDMNDGSGEVGNMMSKDVNGDATAGNADARSAVGGIESGAPAWVIDATTYLWSFELGCGWKETVDNWLRVEKSLAWGQKVSCLYSRNTEVYNRV
jgi:hypothetical protein